MRIQAVAFLLFLILIAVFGYFNRTGWNQNSRLDALHAIVIKGKLAIDDYHVNTGDKAIFDGHFYSDKAPGIIPLALPAFVFSLFVTESRGLPIDSPQGWVLSAWITTVGTAGVLAALGGVATFALLAAHLKRRDAFLVSLFLFLGTITFPYATMLFSHAAVIGLIAIAQWAVCASPGTATDRVKTFALRDILAGVCLGFAIASEYPAVIAAGGILLLVSRVSSARMLRIIAGAAPPLLLIPLYNFATTGHLLTLAYSNHFSFPVLHKVFLGFGIPTYAGFVGQLFGEYRGLFFWSPFLLLAFLGWFDRRLSLRVRLVSAGALFLTVLCISAFPEWDGGGAIGPRYIAACIPLLALPVAWGFQRFPRLGILLGSLSVLLMFLATAVDPMPVSTEYHPFTNLYLKTFPSNIAGAWNLGGRMGLFGLMSLLPLLIIVTVLLAYVLHGLHSTNPVSEPVGRRKKGKWPCSLRKKAAKISSSCRSRRDSLVR
jgi:hypothetical protein